MFHHLFTQQCFASSNRRLFSPFLYLQISSSLKNPVLSTLDVEFKSIFENMTLPQLTQGIRPRSRTRRNFSVCKDAGDKKTEVGNEETTNTNTSNSSRVNSEDEAMRGKDDVEGRNGANNNHVEKIKKKAPICKGEDFKTDEEEEKRGDSSKNKKNSDSGPRSDHEARVEGTASSIPMAMSTRKKRNPLVKMHTHDASTIQESLGKRNKHHDHHSSGHHKKPHRSEPSAYIDVTTDSVERHRPGNLPGPAPYVDVDGIDPIQPAYMGMTVEQWRAFKRSNMADENEFAIDDSLGNIGDGSDW